MRSPAPARVLVLTDRKVAPAISRCGTYEFEDVVCAVDQVDLVPLGPAAGRIVRRVERAFPAAFSPLPAPHAPYELLFTSVHSIPDLAHLHPLGPNLRLARRTAINIDEVWCNQLALHSGDLAMLARFDHVFTACAGGVDALAAAIGKPVTYLPPSVDARRFAPTSALRRVIDIHFMGRRQRELHTALREAAMKAERYYHFDTIQLNPRVSDYAEHRDRLADLIHRSRYFVVDVANSDVPEKTGGQQEFGPRYVEGLAGGAILIGRAPTTRAYQENFWPDAVVPIEPSSSEIARVLDELESAPEKLERTRQRNVARVLLRHDSAYRWERILGAVGLEPLPALAERKRMLARLAAEFEERSA
jgi:hypothetical protein